MLKFVGMSKLQLLIEPQTYSPEGVDGTYATTMPRNKNYSDEDVAQAIGVLAYHLKDADTMSLSFSDSYGRDVSIQVIRMPK